MLTLAHPWLLLLLPLPLLVWRLAPAHREARQGLGVPFLDRLAADSGQRPAGGSVIPRGGWWRTPVLILCWVCTVLALARPQIIEPAISKEVPVRDLLLAVDLSGSMETRDFKNAKGETVDRLTAVKEVLDDFLARRQGDRVGLIFFGSAPFVQAPFTEDLNVCRQLLDEAQVKMAGPQTAFGDALGLAITVFDRSQVKERVLIALTDGNDTASKVPPAKAAQIARDKGIVIHTVAVGDPQAAGEEALDVDALQSAASTTGGLYSHAADHGQLDAIYKRLDEIETRKAQTITHRPRRDVFWQPLAAGFIITLLQQALQLLARREVRSGSPAVPAAAFAAAAPFIAFLPTFHFIRPWWLLALVPAALLLMALRRRQNASQKWHGIIAPHLLPHLLGGQDSQRQRVTPLHLIAFGWAAAVIAIAGPAWRREPAPFADDTAALAIVVKVSPSMKTEDVQPDRLTRSAQKIHDLLAERRGAKTSLIAYAGSAHVVMPATTDEGIINIFAQALDPKIMPVDGDAAVDALKLAGQTLADTGGSILWITDGIAAEQNVALKKWRRQSGVPVRLLPPLNDGDELSALRQNAQAVNASIVPLTPDDHDITVLSRFAKFSTTAAAESSNRWEESGYWLTPLLVFLLLPFFRRGWMTPTAAKP